MSVTMMSCAASNFRPGRPVGLSAAAIVLHRSGTRDALRARFNDPAAGVSAHYLVTRDGSVEQYVLDTDTAFHAGLVVNSTWSLVRVRPDVNPNFYTIGIELEGRADDDWPIPQINAAAALIRDVSARLRIPMDVEHVVLHRDIRASSNCPAPTCPLNRLLADDPLLDTLERSGATTDEMQLSEPFRDETTPGTPVIDRQTLALVPSEFFGETTKKNMVVLHFTAGTTARSAFDTWRGDPRRIATSYVVDVDGTIYEVFPPTAWAAHLGVEGTNLAHDRRSIGIEIANVGPLQPATDDPSTLNWWPKKTPAHPEFTTKFCRLDQRDRYVERDYRGKRHFASFPDVQVDAVSGLVQHLCDRFDIPRTLPAFAKRFDCDVSAFASYKGVCSHANFRKDKWDIGPAFPWDRLSL